MDSLPHSYFYRKNHFYYHCTLSLLPQPLNTPATTPSHSPPSPPPSQHPLQHPRPSSLPLHTHPQPKPPLHAFITTTPVNHQTAWHHPLHPFTIPTTSPSSPSPLQHLTPFPRNSNLSPPPEITVRSVLFSHTKREKRISMRLEETTCVI